MPDTYDGCLSTTAITDAFRRALDRRAAGLVGTPLQETYRGEWSVATSVAASTFWGAPIEVVLPELVSCELHRYGLIEPGLTALFLERVGPGSVVFDVGAHLGYYSMLAEELGAEVHAFEPSERTMTTLRKNVGDRVEVVAKGAWSSETTLHLQDFGSKHSAVNTFVSVRDEELEEPDAVYEVPVTTVDLYVAATGATPDLIKIDAEGAELEVLRGATRTLRSAQPIVTIEVGDTKADSHSRAAIESALELGYSPFDVTPEGLTPHAMRETYGYGNVALLPEGTRPR